MAASNHALSNELKISLEPTSPITDAYENSSDIEDVKDFLISPSTIQKEYEHERSPPVLQSNSCLHCLQPVEEGQGNSIKRTDFEATVISELQAIRSKLEKIEQDVAEIKSRERTITPFGEAKELADTKLLSRTVALAANITRQMEQKTNEDKVELDLELESLFPIESLAALKQLEVRLHDPGFATKINCYLRKMQGTAKNIDCIFRSIATDEVYIKFNLDGRLGKRPLYSLNLFKNILFNACHRGQGRDRYEAEIRRIMHKAHNRYHKKVSKMQKKLNAVKCEPEHVINIAD